jgi:hypothetical protein
LRKDFTVQESDDDPKARRTSDFTEDGELPTLRDAWQRAGLAHRRIGFLEGKMEKLERAFLKDDLGTPDIDGHRAAHADMRESAKMVKEYKVGMTKDLLKMTGAVLGTLLLSGLFQYFRAT